ncbi:zinc finger protein 658B [Aplysia californica]|uniref:Zinc finger protein 658B n=1 Tax=Aplysia californica TaxID=6500 RepID=A0ABM0JMC1_APLCA|nr:zinc finger protein 658B [Aplysia californica]
MDTDLGANETVVDLPKRKRRLKGQWCSAVNCNNERYRRPDLSFFRFPKDKVRCRKWVVNCRRQDLLGKSPESLSIGNVLCSEHFEDSEFMNSVRRNRLNRNNTAVPTLFNLNVPNHPRRTAQEVDLDLEGNRSPSSSRISRSTESTVLTTKCSSSSRTSEEISQTQTTQTSFPQKMVMCCAALWCTNRQTTTQSQVLSEHRVRDLTFHRFPLENDGLLAKWVEAVRRDKFTPTSVHRLCSRHFRESDFIEGDRRRVLKRDAVPSIFDFSKHLVVVNRGSQVLPLNKGRGCQSIHKTMRKIDISQIFSETVAKVEEVRKAAETSVCTVGVQTDPVYILPMEDADLMTVGTDRGLSARLTLDSARRPPGTSQGLVRHHCRICGAAFVGQLQLKLHQWIHQMAQPSSQMRNAASISQMKLATPGFAEKNEGASMSRVLKGVNNGAEGFAADADLGAMEITVLSDGRVITPWQTGQENVPVVELPRAVKQTGTLGIMSGIIVGKKRPVGKLQRSLLKNRLPRESGQVRSNSQGKTPKKCPVCGEMFVRPAALRIHLSEHLYYDIHRGQVLIRGAIMPNTNGTGLGVMEQTSAGEDLSSEQEGPLQDGQAKSNGPVPYNHSDVKGGEFSFVCTLCNVGFMRKKQLRAHRHSEHSSIKSVYKGKTLVLKSLSSSRRKSNSCEICGEVFKSLSSLKVHVLCHEKKSLFKDDICHNDFSTSDALRVHKKLHEAKDSEAQPTEKSEMEKFVCDVCGKTVKSMKQLRYHLASHVGGDTITCRVCKEKFTSRKLLMAHQAEQGHVPNKPIICEVCGSSYSRLYDLKKHHFVAHVKNKDKKARVKHGEKAREEGSFPCEYCGKVFRFRDKLQCHVGKHTGEKSYKCEICHKTFCYSSSLSFHKRKHRETKVKEKPKVRVTCEYCHKVFSSKHVLASHIKYHTGENLHTCEICNKSFVYWGSFILHKRSHAGERPYECDVCHQRFLRPYNLRCHYRIHTGEKPYPCQICGQRFRQQGDRNSHQKRHATQAAKASNNVSSNTAAVQTKVEAQVPATIQIQVHRQQDNEMATSVISVLRG